MTARRGLSVALALGLLPFRGGAQEPPFGPLTWEEGSPFQRLALTPAFERVETTGAGLVSTELWIGYANIFEQDSSATHYLFLDTERLLTAVTVRLGASERLELGARVTLETTGPGLLDGFVHWYHELLGFGQANRDRYPRYGYAQQLGNGGPGLLLDIPRRTMGVDDVQLSAKWRAADALSLGAILRAPVGTNAIGPERADGALVALLRAGGGPWYVHGMLGAGVVRASPGLEPVLRAASAFVGVALERSLARSVSGVAQLQLASPLLRGFDHRELDWPASNLVLGLAGRWGRDWRWDASFQEDVPADTPAIDFTASLRVSRTWR
jgi:hypothetical protein